MELPIGLVTKFSAPPHTASLLAPPPPPHTVLCSHFVLCSHSYRRRRHRTLCVTLNTTTAAHCVHTLSATTAALCTHPYRRHRHRHLHRLHQHHLHRLHHLNRLHRLHRLHCLHRLHRLHPLLNPILLGILPHPRPHTSTPGRGAGVRPPSSRCHC